MKRTTLVLLISVLYGSSVLAQLRLAPIFSDAMVLQRDVKIPVWGVAKAHENIAVYFHDQLKRAQADDSGKWIVYLDHENAGGPFELKVKGSSTIRIRDVLVGEVWLCSGQSNMEWTVGQSANAAEEIARSNYPMIRQVKIAHDINSLPNVVMKPTTWQVCSPKTVSNFTGVGYFYAKQLYEKLGVPIGIINASWGGTNIETWISRVGFEGSVAYRDRIKELPEIALDSLLKLKMANAVESIERLQHSQFTTVAVPYYKTLDYDDSGWPTLHQPGIWEEQRLGNFDGVVWLRKHFIVTREQLASPVRLEIPAIDDNDVTYVNGIMVGETIGWDRKRVYNIPSKVLQEGDNVIAVCVTDNGGGGGIYGNQAPLQLVIGTTAMALDGDWKFQVESIQNSVNENEFPSLCFNAMIHPLVPFSFKGVLWYQGESNAARAYEYRTAFPLLIADWRRLWGTDFPFYFVQLATFATTGDSTSGCPWAELRESQALTLEVPNTGMVVTTDVGDPKSIHPLDKQTVGQRFSALALNALYGQPMVCSGPSYQSVQFKQNQAILTFSNSSSGLAVFPVSSPLKGFEIAGEDQQFYAATAVIEHDYVVVASDAVAHPKAVRFAWKGDASDANLFNKEGYPAVPFRTDDWKALTQSVHYEISVFKKIGFK